MRRRRRSASSAIGACVFAASALASVVVAGCSEPFEQHVGAREQAIVYGRDGRREYYEVEDPGVRAAMRNATAVLIPHDRIAPDGSLDGAPTLGEEAALCAGEPYEAQPALALCTAVLVDWDLLLTAGHCARVVPVDELYAAFDDFYEAPDAIAAGAKLELLPVTEIVAESLSSRGEATRVDYAWLRLAHAVASPRKPLPVRKRVADSGEPIVAIGAALAAPLKACEDARVRDPRPDTLDYFVADTDTSGGSSGGPALDSSRALLGILARGGTDLDDDPAGCATMRSVPQDALAEEQFTYASRALEGLCAADPRASTLCRSECGDRCAALPPNSPGGNTTCSVTVVRAAQHESLLMALTAIAGALARRRNRR